MSELLVFDDEPEPRTALWHACTRVPTAAPGESVTAVLSDMAAKRYDCASVVAVLVGGRLVGVAPIERMSVPPAVRRYATSWIRIRPRSDPIPTRNGPRGRRFSTGSRGWPWSMMTVGSVV